MWCSSVHVHGNISYFDLNHNEFLNCPTRIQYTCCCDCHVVLGIAMYLYSGLRHLQENFNQIIVVSTQVLNRTGFKSRSKVSGKEVRDWNLGRQVTRVTGGDLGQSERPKGGDSWGHMGQTWRHVSHLQLWLWGIKEKNWSKSHLGKDKTLKNKRNFINLTCVLVLLLTHTHQNKQTHTHTHTDTEGTHTHTQLMIEVTITPNCDTC